jgi:hypothetical protein
VIIDCMLGAEHGYSFRRRARLCGCANTACAHVPAWVDGVSETLSEAEARKTRGAAYDGWKATLGKGSMVFVLGHEEDAEDFDHEEDFWGATLGDAPQVATCDLTGSAGPTKKGKDYGTAQWQDLSRECPDGSLVYNAPAGPSFPLPLATCLYVAEDDGDITNTRHSSTLDSAFVGKLREEMAAWH